MMTQDQRIERRLRWLTRVYAEYNLKYWEGRLPPAYSDAREWRDFVRKFHHLPVSLEVTRVDDAVEYYACLEGSFTIRYCYSVLLWAKPYQLRRILLHEMCHYSAEFVDQDTPSEERGADHGWSWRFLMEMLYEKGERWVMRELSRYPEPEFTGMAARAIREARAVAYRKAYALQRRLIALALAKTLNAVPADISHRSASSMASSGITRWCC
jgi:hypothetical protein